MPSGEIISDAEVAALAQEDVRSGDAAPSSAIGVLAKNGRILDGFQGWARRNDFSGVDSRLEKIRAYVHHHGARGPVDGWPSEDGVS